MRVVSPFLISANCHCTSNNNKRKHLATNPDASASNISPKGLSNKTFNGLPMKKFNPVTDKIPFNSLPKGVLSKEPKLNVLNDEIKNTLSIPVVRAETKLEQIKSPTGYVFQNATTFFYDDNNELVCKNQGTGFIFYSKNTPKTHTQVAINENTGEITRASVELYDDNVPAGKISYDIFNGCVFE